MSEYSAGMQLNESRCKNVHMKMSKNDYVRVCVGDGRDFPSSWILTFFMIEDKVKSYTL